ncbi:MAG: glycosyltransferase [Planctomycetota bacterium]
MLITVVIPTFRRPSDLRRCLDALAEQSRGADEVLVVSRPEDRDGIAVAQCASNKLPLRRVEVDRPGLVHALQVGLDSARGDVVAFTDDDSVARSDWLERIESHFDSSPRIVGVGGRDWVHELGTTLNGSNEDVGRLTWYGRMIGNHHLGVGVARDVDALKGVNMAYRRGPLLELGFDRRLRGQGAQVANEIAVGLPLRKAGWRLVYDPLVAVDHFPSVRTAGDHRQRPRARELSDAAFNEALPILEYLPLPQRPLFLFWAILVGTRRYFGLAQAIRFTPKLGLSAWAQFVATASGRIAATKG